MDVPDAAKYEIAKSDFKIVYVAPMKALAAEIVQKMGSRLQWLGISVRELTGDMQLSRDEIQTDADHRDDSGEVGRRYAEEYWRYRIGAKSPIIDR